MMQVKAKWDGDLRFVTEIGAHAVATDVPESDGTGGTAPTPIELVLAGLAACSGVDVATILTRMRLPLRKLEISVEAQRADEHPRIFTHIIMKYVVTGNIPENRLEKAIDLSARTYCSVGAMLGANCPIEYVFEILPDSEPA